MFIHLKTEAIASVFILGVNKNAKEQNVICVYVFSISFY